ncbi:uncharacterized protein LOC132909650 [Bombus pascuorum]|uniref:uncharacterized protein LOC132909650 n=1 Tax=Bombus pascuorum TaxID=65598 RepID=UPI00213FDDC9|nr:uncharacterized protein LOC132909650 [Bombus pascuorum]
MERHEMNMNSNNSGSIMQTLNNSTTHNNTVMIKKENHTMDLKRLGARIICSDNITRQNLNKKPSASTTIVDDDDQFFNKIKLKIDKNLLLHCKENYKPGINYQSMNLLERKRPIIDIETQNVIKRFKKDTNYINSLQSSNNSNIVLFNHIDNFMKEKYNISTNVNKKDIIERKNMFSPKFLNTNFRIPASKYIFQVTSKLQTNVLPLPTDETTILREEYEESLFYGMMYLTPPDSNSIEANIDS